MNDTVHEISGDTLIQGEGAFSPPPNAGDPPRSPASFFGFAPYGDHALVRRVSGPGAWKLPPGFYVPEKYEKKIAWAIVVAVSPLITEKIVIGDVLMLRIWGGTVVKLNGEELICISPDHVLAILN